MVAVSSLTTISTHLILGSLSFCTCFFTVASKARSGVKRPVLHPGRRRGTGEEQPGWAGEEKEGSESQAEPGAGVEDGTDTREERDTDTEKERQKRRQCERGTWPSCPPGSAPPRCCQATPRALRVWEGSEGPSPCPVQGHLLSSYSLPRACLPPLPHSSATPSLPSLSLSFSYAILLRS